MLDFLINALKIIFLLGFLILIHECGHFFVARLCKIKVNEFSIGFGKLLFKKMGKETQYSLRLIPLGGYVNLEGEEKESEEEGSFSKASIPKRMAIILAGGLTNIVFAIIVFFILSLIVINTQGENISFGLSIKMSFLNVGEFISSIFESLKMLFTGQVTINDFIGPVGISEVVVKTTDIQNYIYLLCLISMSLGITNLLPFPALDGGKFVLLIIEAIRGKKLSEKVETNIQLIGFSLLILLSIYVAYNDILRIK